MKLKHLFTLTLTLAASGGLFAATGCSSAPDSEDRGATSSTGSVGMALTATTNGTVYRLQGAAFHIARADGTPQTQLVSSDDTNETVLSAVIPTGNYTADLQDGWSLQRLDTAGQFVTVQATLVSPDPVPFTINANATTQLVYQFSTDGTIITIGNGVLNISIAVTETGGSACTAFGSGCPASAWCAPAALLQDPATGNFCLPAGPLPPGAPCTQQTCTLNSVCADITGDGLNECVELCAPSQFGTPCPTSGLICQPAGDSFGACI